MPRQTKSFANVFQHPHSNALRIMKTKFHCLFLFVWMTAVAASAVSPQVFHAALKKLYPQADKVGWSQEGDYYVASFAHNGFDKKVWMNAHAGWIMTNIDLETADRLPPMVYNEFIFSQYTPWTVTDVNLIKSPRRPALYVITVNQDNSVSTWQLFYAADGSPVYTRDVSYINPELSPRVLGLP